MKTFLVTLITVVVLSLFVGEVYAADTPKPSEVSIFSNRIVNLKAALMPVQKEILDNEDKKPTQLSIYYDVAAKAFNKADDSFKAYELASKIGVNLNKSRKQFIKDITMADLEAAKLFQLKGIQP